MTIVVRYLPYRRVRKVIIIFRTLLTLFLILTFLPLAACAPRIPNAPSENPAAAVDVNAAPVINAVATSLIFLADSDAQVNESRPSRNNGNATYLQVDGGRDPAVESFIHFTVTGISAAIQTARLRVYDTTNATTNGPAVFATDPAWTETGITWKSRPARISGELDNQENIAKETWAEYDVTSFVKGNGEISFVLAADSGDAATFSSRQGKEPPQLVITLADGPTATADRSITETPIVTLTPSETQSPDITPSATLPAGDIVFVGAGDISTCNNDNDELTAQLLDTIPGIVFTTGDNAYSDGTYSEFTKCYDPTWGRHKDRTKPVPGNHEYNTAGGAGYFQYFTDIPPYYAYNLGSWRIYALNSEIDVSAGSSQITWLQADLASNPSQCVLAYWHQPRWSSGSNHGSDNKYQTLWEVLYQAGAELVLNGHEHNYERFAPMNAAGQADPLGLREFVIGTGGRSLYDFGTPLITSEVRDNTSYGVLKLTLHENNYDWEFIPAAGSTFTDSGSADCH